MIGGAYKQFAGPPEEAKRRAMAFTGALFGNRYLDVHVFRTSTCWSKWFLDVAWDLTWIVADDRTRRAFLICLTDTD